MHAFAIMSACSFKQKWKSRFHWISLNFVWTTQLSLKRWHWFTGNVRIYTWIYYEWLLKTILFPFTELILKGFESNWFGMRPKSFYIQLVPYLHRRDSSVHGHVRYFKPHPHANWSKIVLISTKWVINCLACLFEFEWR